MNNHFNEDYKYYDYDDKKTKGAVVIAVLCRKGTNSVIRVKVPRHILASQNQNSIQDWLKKQFYNFEFSRIETAENWNEYLDKN